MECAVPALEVLELELELGVVLSEGQGCILSLGEIELDIADSLQ